MNCEENKWQCTTCNEIFKTRRLLYSHRKVVHNSTKEHPIFELGGRCNFCGREIKFKCNLKVHERHCKFNPNRIPRKGHKHTAEEKEQIRQNALKGYAEGRWHGWMNCHSSKKSYPEEFFTKVILNDFNDKNFEYNFLFYQYKLDFAWPIKKKCIEIDGEQHFKNRSQYESDQRKDQKLLSDGWTVLRIRWKDMYNDPQKFIKLANDFIGG